MIAPDIHEEYLQQLRQQRDEKRKQLETLSADLKRLNDAVTALESLQARAPVPQAPAIMVEAGQYKGMRNNHALMRLMVANPRPYKSRDLANALFRGGQGPDESKIRTMVKHHLKDWRHDDLVRFHDTDLTWELTARGREVFAQTSEPQQPSSQSLFSAHR